jgi:hypothetical protein
LHQHPKGQKFFNYLAIKEGELRQLLNGMESEGYTMAKWYAWDKTTVPPQAGADPPHILARRLARVWAI